LISTIVYVKKKKILQEEVDHMSNKNEDLTRHVFPSDIKISPSDRKPYQDVFSILVSGHTITKKNLQKLKKNFSKSVKEKTVFFDLLATYDSQEIEMILDQLYVVDDSPRWLISMREEFLDFRRENRKIFSGESLQKVNMLHSTFSHYFNLIFNVQYLSLRDCDENNTPVRLIKFMAEKEGVHPSEHWWSFEDRISRPDRKILALEHFKMPLLPLVYVEIALEKEIVRNIPDIMNPKAGPVKVGDVTTAMFYSINSPMKGLGGIGMGEKMIMRAVDYLSTHYPQVKQFSTLSPVPKFRSFVDSFVAFKTGQGSPKTQPFDFESVSFDKFLSNSEKKEIAHFFNIDKDKNTEWELFRNALQHKDWYKEPLIMKVLKRPMTTLLIRYITKVKRITDREGKLNAPAFDPVANFHLSNGAFLGGVNYGANLSERGFRESYGCMINYIYDVKKTATHRLEYRKGTVISRV